MKKQTKKKWMKNKQGKSTLYIIIIVLLILIIVGYAAYTYYINFVKKYTYSSQMIVLNQTTIKTKVQTTTIKIYTTYPNQNLTPGDIEPILSNDSSYICTPGYSASIRNVSVALKKQVFAEYRLVYPPHDYYEVDHFIPLELGGSNSIRNLWPEPASPKPGYHEKDLVENYLHRIVCNGTINLSTAQDMIKKDWVAVYNSCCKK